MARNKFSKKLTTNFDVWLEFFVNPEDDSIFPSGWKEQRELYKTLEFDGPHYVKMTFTRWTTEVRRELKKLASEFNTNTQSFLFRQQDLLYWLPKLLLVDWDISDENDNVVPLERKMEQLGSVFCEQLTEDSFSEFKSLPTTFQEYFLFRAYSILERDSKGDKNPQEDLASLEKNLKDDGSIDRFSTDKEKNKEDTMQAGNLSNSLVPESD